MHVTVRAEWQVAVARQKAVQIAQSVGMDALRCAYVSTAATELAENLVSHTVKGGVLSIRRILDGARSGIELVAEDEGPGIPDVLQAMQDGFSTDGGLGGGLPGTKRLMDEFEIYSEVGVGTRVVCRGWCK